MPRAISLAALALAIALTLTAAAPAFAAAPQALYGPVGVEASPQIFAVMCSLYASGFPVEASVASQPGFADLEARLTALHGPATEALRSYYRTHALGDPGATLSRYITFALLVGQAPKFPLLAQDPDLPPDAVALGGFSQVLASFYQEAGIAELWNQWEPAYNKQVAGMIEAVSRVTQQETAYLREAPPEASRNFVVYVEPLVGSLSNARNIGDHYALVINPAAQPLGQIRHTLLHFFLDPLPLSVVYFTQIHVGAPVLHYAAQAPSLPADLRDDFTSYFTECLVRAVELRLRKLPAADQAAELDRADGTGYVLVRPIVTSLVKFEASQPSFTLYFPDLLHSIDFVAEAKRAQGLTYLPMSLESVSGQPETASSARAQTKLNQVLEADLGEGARLLSARDAAGAAKVFERILQAVPAQPRAEYGLAITYVMQGDADQARAMFEQIVAQPVATNEEAKRDALALAWSHIYLGRMSDLEGDRDTAVTEYRAALAVADAPDAARAAAQQGVQQAYQPPKPNDAAKPNVPSQ